MLQYPLIAKSFAINPMRTCLKETLKSEASMKKAAPGFQSKSNDMFALQIFKLKPRSISLAGRPPLTPQLFNSGSCKMIYDFRLFSTPSRHPGA